MIVVLLSITRTCTAYIPDRRSMVESGRERVGSVGVYLSWPLASFYAYCMCSIYIVKYMRPSAKISFNIFVERKLLF